MEAREKYTIIELKNVSKRMWKC